MRRMLAMSAAGESFDCGGSGSLEQFEQVAPPMPNQLVPITSKQHDQHL